tara:strand:- start:106 stop:213 length:108 start_codon:yes stop_codon:yes gene_type:complete
MKSLNKMILNVKKAVHNESLFLSIFSDLENDFFYN